MPRPSIRAAAVCGACALLPAHAADDADLQLLHEEMQQLRRDYETRLKALEARIEQLQQRPPPASVPPPAPLPETAGAGANAFNPAVSLILSGRYADLSRDPKDYAIAGFRSGSDIGPGPRGLSLGESELSLSANIDPWFYGSLAAALHDDDTASVEEAYVQTTALPAGLTVRAGRFFSGVGYLNEQHAHVWDFADAPLAYAAFLGGQLAHDGVQLRALLPTERFVELGAELGRGGAFPAEAGDRNGPGSAALFAHTGGDFGASSGWRAGLSRLWSRSRGRETNDFDSGGSPLTTVFSGTGNLWVADAVWKWAPNGNPQRTNVKFQGEYFHGRESGDLTADATTDRYAATRSGWYAQAVWQFAPAWRTGLRVDRLNLGSVRAGANDATLLRPDFSPSRASAMLDWSASEFSRVRLQLARERTRLGDADRQLILQYQMSLGAHGAHGF